MWVLLSRRLRAWVLLAVALPLARLLVHRLAATSARRNPDATTSGLLRRADSALTRVTRRARRDRG